MSGDQLEEMQSYIDDVFELVSEQPENSVTRDELQQEFKKFMEYGVPLEHAKQTLLKKYTDQESSAVQTSERVLIHDIEPNAFNVNLLGRILSINPKEITARGEPKTIFYGILADESGTISFTAWHDFQLSKGDVVSISNAYTKEWQGNPQLNFGEKSQVMIKKDSTLETIQNEPREFKVKDFRAGLGSVIATAQIVEVNKREVEVNSKKKTVFSGVLADETGKAQFTAWHDFKLSPDDVVKITGGYVKSWKGIPQFTFDEKATVKKLQRKKLVIDFDAPQHLTMHELVEKRGGLDIEVTGTVIAIKNGSGLVQRCPECNRVVYNGECSIHGSVKGVEDLRLKLVLDDGSGTVNCTLGKQPTEELLDTPLKQWKTLDADEFLKEKLYGHRLTIAGNALGDQYGTTVIGKQAMLSDYQVVQETDKILQSLEDIV